MTKIMTLVKSNPKLSAGAFAEAWRSTFLPAILALPTARNLQKVVHNHVFSADVREGEGMASNPWSGLASYYFQSQSDAEALLADPAFQALFEVHGDIFFEVTHLLADEIWIYNHDTSNLPVKMFAFFKCKPHLSRREGLDYYRDTHAAVGASVNKNRTVRYVQNRVVEGYTNPMANYNYDGGPEIWFKTMDLAMDLLGDREAMDVMTEDEENFVTRSETIHFLTDEHIVFQR
jgi:hypothetical protein